MGFAMDILSKEEAMALPPKQRPLCYRVNGRIFMAVHEAIGQASLCWRGRDGKCSPPVDEFDAALAGKIAAELCFLIADELDKLKPDRDASQ